jgi:surface antigen
VTAYSNGSTGYVGPYETYGYQFQCVEYINRFYVEALGHENMRGTGNARDYYSTAASRDLDAYLNDGSVCPQVGDILCSNGGTHGHIAIVKQLSWGTVHVIQQNWFNDRGDDDMTLTLTRSIGHYNVSGFNGSYPIQGWLRKSGISDTAWNFYDGRDGWVVDGSSSIIDVFYPPDAPDGAIRINPGTSDPRMWSPSGLYIDPTTGGGYTHVIIRMASNCMDLHAQLFYITTSDTIWTGGKSKSFDLFSRGDWHIYDLNMSGDMSWTHGGRITQLRLDPAANGDVGSGDTVGIDYIRLSTTGLNICEHKTLLDAISIFISPNPFNSSCAITALVGAEIKIYDLNGKCIEVFDKTPVIWQPDESIASGIYLVRARMEDGWTASKRVVYLK